MPQTYLAGFTDTGTKDGKFYALNLDTRRGFLTKPQNVAKERDFNRVDIAGQNIDALENALSRFESELAVSLTSVRTTKRFPSVEELNDILNLISLVGARNPRIRRALSELNEQQATRWADELVADPETFTRVVTAAVEAGYINDADVSYERMKQFVDERAFTVETPRGMHHYVEFNVQDDLLSRIGRRNWYLGLAEYGGLICGDMPAVLWPKRSSSRPSLGIDSRETELIFPLSTHLVLIGSFEAPHGVVRCLDPLRVARINRRVLGTATKQIYCAAQKFFTFGAGGGRVIKIEL